jgi:hypothetical protein
MFVKIEDMPIHSRVWIYQSDRQLSEEEVSILEGNTVEFLKSWSAHGNGLKSSTKVFWNRFLVVMVDEQQAMASGCSIDASVHFVQSIGSSMKIDFFNRTKVAFKEDDGIRVESLSDIKGLVASGVLSPSSVTFNNLVQNKGEFDTKWLSPASETWLSRYFKKEESVRYE